MRYRSDDGGFGSGMGGSFGTSSGYDPHREWDGPLATRGVGRDGSRVPRQHEDEHAVMAPMSPQRRAHLSEWEARQQGWHGGQSNGPPYPAQQQHGYGLSQYGYPEEQAWGGIQPGTDMGLGERDHERGPHYGKGPKGYKRSDDRVREEICELMSRQGYIDASDVEVTVEAGVVRLVGLVESRHDKRGLEQMTERVHGVEEVQNEIRLRRSAQRTEQTVASTRSAPQSTPRNGNPPTTALNGRTS